MTKLFEKYQLRLKTIHGSIHVITDNDKVEILSQFLDHWHRPKDLLEDLLPELDAVLKGTLSDSDIDADVIGLAHIEPEITKLIGSDIGYKDMELSTLDFRGLIMEWIGFLESKK